MIELLVVIAIIALLFSILLPSLNKAKELARNAACKMSIRILQIGNVQYQADWHGFYAPAAPLANNLGRWFGSRTTSNPQTTPFSLANGPLLPYLPGGAVRICPSFKDFDSGFETGCGGFGYNSTFVGSYINLDGHTSDGQGIYTIAGIDSPSLSGNRSENFNSPDETIAFTDTAFASKTHAPKTGIIEYSFSEPPRGAMYSETWSETASHRPSIHFRHLGKANVVWLDSHVSEEPMSFSNNSCGYAYKANPIDYNIGFFGPDDYSLFDLE